jgi:ferredoxin, 2Fe-2S
MITLTFIDSEGTPRQIQAEEGSTLMEAAVKNGIPGIVAECGGACACATCHIYIHDEWQDRVSPPGDMEEGMLDFAFDTRSTSRLSCQIRLRTELDGLIVHTPAFQA